MRARLATLVLALIASGCLAADPRDDPATDPGVGSGERPGPVDMSLTGCIEVGAGRLLSFEDAAALLPEGFVPGEAADFLGMPTPTGRAVVLTGHLECEGSVLDGGPVTWSDIIVYVETPSVEGVDLDDGRADLYQLAHFSSGSGTIAALQAVGLRAEVADVHLAPLVASALPLAHGQTDVDGAQVMRYDVAAGAPQPYHLFARFWHETPSGLVFVEHDRTPTQMLSGTLTRCEAAAGTIFAEAFGGTDCTGPDAIGGLFPEPTDIESTLRVLPGARAG